MKDAIIIVVQYSMDQIHFTFCLTAALAFFFLLNKGMVRRHHLILRMS